MVRKLVVQPDGFMERKVGQPNMRREIITVLVIGILGAIGFAYVAQLIADQVGSDTSVFSVIGIAATPIIGAILIWMWYSIALHLIAGQFNTRGPIRRFFKLTAWAMIPIGIGNLIKSAAVYFAYQGVDPASIVEGSNAEPMDAVLTAVTGEVVYLLAVVISIGMILWTGYLLTFAVQNARDLPRDSSLKVVAIPVAAHVLFVVWTLAQSAEILG